MPTFLNDAQLEELEHNSDYMRHGDKCPTCQDTGTYRFEGRTYECPLDEFDRHIQRLLFERYCLANIPLEFQKLQLSDFPNSAIVSEVRQYIEAFPTLRFSGLGYEIFGKSKGVGKTFLATSIAKELIHQGDYSTYFMWFRDALSMKDMESKRRWHLEDKMLNSEILVLDEVLEPNMSERQRAFFEDGLEGIIRDRTSRNRPTIITTNLETDQMSEFYPRVYSLLSGKQQRIELSGEDYREKAWYDTTVLSLNGEVRPIF